MYLQDPLKSEEEIREIWSMRRTDLSLLLGAWVGGGHMEKYEKVMNSTNESGPQASDEKYNPGWYLDLAQWDPK